MIGRMKQVDRLLEERRNLSQMQYGLSKDLYKHLASIEAHGTNNYRFCTECKGTPIYFDITITAQVSAKAVVIENRLGPPLLDEEKIVILQYLLSEVP